MDITPIGPLPILQSAAPPTGAAAPVDEPATAAPTATPHDQVTISDASLLALIRDQFAPPPGTLRSGLGVGITDDQAYEIGRRIEVLDPSQFARVDANRDGKLNALEVMDGGLKPLRADIDPQ